MIESLAPEGARGPGFDTYLRRVVFLSKDNIFTPRKVLVIFRKR